MIDEEINLDIINIETNVSSGPNVESSITTGMNITDVGIGGPRGEKGDKGDTGTQGAKGDTGATGPQGPQGIQGEKGEKGDKGDKGEKGDTGATGPQGPQGEKGTKGDQGIQGPKGDTGPQGPQGEKGDTGAKGDKGDKGDTGPQGPQGEKGDTGDVSDVQITGTSVVNAGVANIDYASLNTGGVVRVNPSYGINTASTGTLIGVTKEYSNYTSGSDLVLIDKGTLENVITGKGLVSNTDYADNDTGGVIKIGSSYGTAKSSSGNLIASVKNYEDYSSAGNYMLIGKGTLENVITGKRLTANKNYYGTCSTAASQAAKVVVCEGFVLETGAHISVEFVNSCNVSGTVTLNVNSTGAVDIANVGTDKNIQRIWQPGEIVDFVYDGTNYVIVKGGFATTVFYGLTKLSDSTSSTSTDLAATANSVKTAYDLANSKQDALTAGTGIDITNNVISATGGGTVSGETIYYGVSNSTGTGQAKIVTVDNGFTLHDGALVRVLFANGQTYNGAPTLNVNNTGAKTIQYKSGTNAMRYIWTSGQVVDFVYRQASDVWIMVMGSLATTSYYGLAKLVTSAASDSQSLALTPRALFYLANYSIAPYYSASGTYAVGDKVRYSYYIYECITAIDEPEAWTAAHWQQIDTLQEQIDALEGSIPTVNNATITVTNNGKTVGTFTTNASSAVTIALKTQHTSWGAYHEL